MALTIRVSGCKVIVLALMQNRLLIHGALLLVGLIYGANYLIAKLAMPDYFSPFAFIVLRVSVATGLFWLLDALVAKKEQVAREDMKRLFVCAIFGVAVNQLCFFSGLNCTSPVNASLIMTLVPAIVMVVSYFVLRESVGWQKLLGLGLGMLGAVLLVFSKEAATASTSFLGDLFIFINASSYSTYLVIVKPLMKKYRSLTVIKWVFLFGLPMVIPFGFYDVQAVAWAELPAFAWYSLAFVIIGTTFLAYLLNAWSLSFVNASVVGIYIYVQPVFAGMLTIALGYEDFSWYKLLLGLLIFAGVFLVSNKRS